MPKIYVHTCPLSSRPTSGEVIAYVCDVETLNVECLELSSEDQFLELVRGQGVTHVMFQYASYPRRAVPIDKARSLFRKLWAELSLPRCPTCGYPMRQTRRGATLAKNGPAYVCPVAESEVIKDAIGNLQRVRWALHTDTRVWTNAELEQAI